MAATFSYTNDGLGMARFAIFGTPVNPISFTIASATTLPIISYLTIVTGTVGVQNIQVPWPGFEGDIILIYTDAAPGATQTGGTTGMAIQLASAVVRYKALCMTYSQINQIWYPSY